MDRFRQKSKKEKPMKNVEKDKFSSLYIPDTKSIKENLKIKEILKTVKMNRSKGMDNKAFNDIDEDFSDDIKNDETENEDFVEPPSATNPELLLTGVKGVINNKLGRFNSFSEMHRQYSANSENTITEVDENIANQSSEDMTFSNQTDSDNTQSNMTTPELKTPDIILTTLQTPIEQPNTKVRYRKLSLDNTMLTRRESLSQSELDLNSIGKSPLERKSSFFKKKMDRFIKNTSEIFKRQSSNGKSQSLQRRGSISLSLQSLNDKNSICNSDICEESLDNQDPFQGSMTSLQSSSTTGHSSCHSMNKEKLTHPNQESELSLVDGSQTALSSSQPLDNVTSNSVHSLNEAYVQEPLSGQLNSRAISMSSGLDSALGQRRRKSNRLNRVTWVASEGLSYYLKRIQNDMRGSHSCQDFCDIPENNLCEPKLDTKGRRLSYQRAVSGEDPMINSRLHDSRKKSPIPENSKANYELVNYLAEFSKNGLPPLKGFCIANVSEEARRYLHWAEIAQNLEEFYELKKLNTNEEARQAVIRELVNTEAVYVRHLMSIVEVFIAVAHALQDAGKLLDVDTERLFSNIPDVLNASMIFWEITFYPMLADAGHNRTPFNTELMSPGFCRFRELFAPYEKYVSEQSKALDYLRSLTNNTEFMIYLSWCHGHKSCNRLQLSDIMVKPMQRLTKYSVILDRIIKHTDTEPERTSLIAMNTFVKNYVLDLNRSIRQRDELEKLDALAYSIDAYEIDFKDDDMDRLFRMYSQLNLKAPMVNCLASHSRTLIHEGDLRFKDNLKEVDVRAFLLTDMLLICKKFSKGGPYSYRMIRPKFMVDKMLLFPKFNIRNSKELSSLIFVMVDEVGSAYHTFAFSETAKDSTPQITLKLWEQKVKEAKLTYDLGVWFAKNPSRDLSEVEMDSSSDYAVSGASAIKPGVKQSSDDVNIEREARERVAAMLHRSMGASTEYDFSQASMTTDSFDADQSYKFSTGEASGTSSAKTPGLHSLRHPMQRNSTGGSSRNSRISSFHQSTSATSHDEPQAGPNKYNYRAGSSVEHVITPFNPDNGVTSITVNVVSESESETVVPRQQQLTLHKLTSRSSSTSQNTLRVQPQSGVLALVHSLPDLTLDPMLARPTQSQGPQSASEKLYQSHQELLQRNRLSASHHHQSLSPDHRGTSYPPPSPTRASLKRGLAFSHSLKYPPLSKMGHVNSQSQLPADAAASTSQLLKIEKGVLNAILAPSTSNEKGDKKSKHVSSRHKGSGGGSLSPGRKEDKGD